MKKFEVKIDNNITDKRNCYYLFGKKDPTNLGRTKWRKIYRKLDWNNNFKDN